MRAGRVVRCTSERLPNVIRSSLLAALACCVAGGAWLAFACGWGGWEHSVRFSYWAAGREPQRLPPLPFKLRDAERTEDAGAGDEIDYYTAEQLTSETASLWERAREARDRGELEKARAALRDYAASEYGEGRRRNSAVDQLDALGALDQGSPVERVRAYLEARRVYDAWSEQTNASNLVARHGAESKRGVEDDACQTEKPTAEDVLRALDSVPRDANLEDNVAYLRAAVSFLRGDVDAAARGFAQLAARHPRSEKRDAALYMAGRARMSQSKSYNGAGNTATSTDPCREPDCRDEAWTKAREFFARVAGEHARGRYAAAARGWLAYLSLRVGDKAGALAEYYRMLSDERDPEAVAEAIRSLRLVRGRADDVDMQRVEEELADEPRAALAYAYHNIYNYTFSYYLNVPESAVENPYQDCHSCSSEAKWRWDEAQQGRLRRRAERGELARVVRFSTRMMNRYPRHAAGGAFTLRVAQASFELDDPRMALGLARRALAQNLAGAERASALYLKAAAEYRLREFDAARRTLTGLVAEFPDGDLSTLARRLLATVAEEAGDLDAALEQYLALGYDADAAYFVDVLMTVDQLASFVARHESSSRRDELLYALGVRYLRAGRYTEARQTLRRVRTVSAQSSYDSYYYSYGDDDATERYPKYNFHNLSYAHLGGEDYCYYDETCDRKGSGAGVYADWVLRDLQTADELEALEAAVNLAAGDEAKAEAMYQLASYLYEGSNLKFYNPLAWRGMRAEHLGALNETNYRSPGEADILWRHAQEHEPVARALVVYLDLVRRYPRTRAAPDALYTAVHCQQQLAEYNGYWRNVYAMGLHAGERDVTYEDLRRAYPQYRLPRGTYGWEPSTRTVSGEPAWDKPRPAPPLTRTEKVRRQIRRGERAASKAWGLFGEVAGGRARRWSLALLSACGIWLVFRRTRGARQFLFDQLARRTREPHNQPAVVSFPVSSYGAHLPYAGRSRAHAALRHAARGVWEVALDGRVRAALLLNLFTHGLLTALAWALVWALRQ